MTGFGVLSHGVMTYDDRVSEGEDDRQSEGEDDRQSEGEEISEPEDDALNEREKNYKYLKGEQETASKDDECNESGQESKTECALNMRMRDSH